MTALDDAFDSGSIVWGEATLLSNWRGDDDGPADIYCPPILDNFLRPDSNGVVANGWGTSDSGMPWAVGTPAADFLVGSGLGTISISQVNNTRTVTNGWAGHAGGTELRFDYQMPVAPLTASARVRVRVDRNSSNNSHVVQFDTGTGGAQTWAILRENAGTLTTVTSGSFGIGFTAGEWISVRVQTIPTAGGQKIRFRWWRAVNAEPTAWSGNATDATLTWQGNFSLQTYLQTGNTNTLPFIVNFRSFSSAAIDKLYPAGWTSSVSLDKGVPSEVSSTSASGVPQFGADLMAPNGWSNPGQYFSKQYTSSPVYGFDRDLADITLDVEVVTATGLQATRVFTGQMTDVPTTATSASLEALSKSRNRLRRAIQLPPIDGSRWGLDSGALVDMLAYKCGISSSYPIPPLVNPTTSSVKTWMPCHGTAIPYNYGSGFNQQAPPVQQLTGTASGIFTGPFQFTSGPFVSAMDNVLNASIDRHFVYGGIITDNGGAIAPQEYYTAALFSTNSGHGICQAMWYVRGDTVVTPGPLGTPTRLSSLTFQTSYPTSSVVVTGGVNMSRNVFLTFDDGVNTRTLTSAGTVPSDGLWHKVGFFFDINNNAMKVYLDGTVGSLTPSPAISLTNIAATFYDYWAVGYPEWWNYLSCSDLVILCGSQADPTIAGWIADRPATSPGLLMRPGLQQIPAYAMPSPREAYEVIQEIAQGELAWNGFDASDRLCYLPMSYWAEAAQQPASPPVLSTEPDEVNAVSASIAPDILVTRDVTRIYNQITVGYQQQSIAQSAILYQSNTSLPIPPGVTVYRFNFSNPAITTIVGNFAPSAFSGIPTFLASQVSYFVLNSAADGSGSDYLTTVGGAIFQTTTFDSGGLTVSFRNADYRTWYMVSADSSKPAATIFGTALVETGGSAFAQDDTSVNGRRGPRSLPVALPAIKSYPWALFIATELAARYATPRTTVTATVMPDLRRKPGDMVRITDPERGLNGLFRLVSIDTSGSPGGITQAISAEEAWQVGSWDQSSWDSGVLWGA